MATPLVLIVDDRPAEQLAVAQIVQESNCHVLFADAIGQSAPAIRDDIEVVICLPRIGSASGVEFMRRWHALRPETSFLFLIPSESADDSREAVKAGAAGCLLEPIDGDELREWIDRCLELHKLHDQIQQLQLRLDKRLGFETVVGKSKAMRQLLGQARTAADSTSAVLISGEPGTGRSLLAETIHQNSRRRGGPFVALDVTGLTVRNVEQELFGVVDGAAVAAADSHKGRLEAALGGTLFIDDVAELAAVTQARLLRSLDRQELAPSRGGPARAMDVRIIAATARKLEALAAEGRFSASLFRRISVIHLRLPPLRERREDIPELVHHLLERVSSHDARRVPAIEPELLRFFERFDWPGNVRQLRSCLESMVARSKDDHLTLDDLPAGIDDPTQGVVGMYFPAGMSLAEMERSAVEQALVQSDGNRTRAAVRLGISVRTLQRKLKVWSLEGMEGHEESPSASSRSV